MSIPNGHSELTAVRVAASKLVLTKNRGVTMKIIFFIICLLGLVTVVIIAGQPSTEVSQFRLQESQTKCGNSAGNLQLCTTTSFITTKLGENLPLRLIVKNLSDKPISVIKASFDDIYEIKVSDFRGNRISSKKEVLATKINKTAEEKALVEELPLNSSPQNIQILPKQDLRLEYNLADFYDLKSKGKYHVEISRKISKSGVAEDTYLLLAGIEVEVK